MEETDVQNMELLQKRISENRNHSRHQNKGRRRGRPACAGACARRPAGGGDYLPHRLRGGGDPPHHRRAARARSSARAPSSPSSRLRARRTPARPSSSRPGRIPRWLRGVSRRASPFSPASRTPSDIEKALSLGLKTVKFFPAEASGGVAMLKAMSAPYGDVRFMPTGGINEKNLLGVSLVPQGRRLRRQLYGQRKARG